MLDLLFGLMLAAAPLNDPMDDTGLDGRGTASPVAALETIEPAAGSSARPAGLGERRTAQIGNHR